MRNGSVTLPGSFGHEREGISRGPRTALALCVMVGLVLIAVTQAAPLPAGNTGIAARYPLDAGIAADPAVIFADDFESYSSVSNLTSQWNKVFHTDNLRIATESSNVFAGGKSLELTVPRTSGEVSNTLLKTLSPNGTCCSCATTRSSTRDSMCGLQPQWQHHLGPLLLPGRPRRRIQQVSRQLRSVA